MVFNLLVDNNTLEFSVDQINVNLKLGFVTFQFMIGKISSKKDVFII